MFESDLTVSIIESIFAPSETTDGILVVEGTKLYVNKGLLSTHSTYFKSLFDSQINGTVRDEIQIADVCLEDFATVLSFIHPNPVEPNEEHLEFHLELAEKFKLPAAKRHLELYIALSTGCFMSKEGKLDMADKFQMDVLMKYTLKNFEKKDYKNIYDVAKAKNYSEKTKAMIFDDFFFHYGEDL